jgi:hypothetical protein
MFVFLSHRRSQNLPQKADSGSVHREIPLIHGTCSFTVMFPEVCCWKQSSDHIVYIHFNIIIPSSLTPCNRELVEKLLAPLLLRNPSRIIVLFVLWFYFKTMWVTLAMEQGWPIGATYMFTTPTAANRRVMDDTGVCPVSSTCEKETD